MWADLFSTQLKVEWLLQFGRDGLSGKRMLIDQKGVICPTKTRAIIPVTETLNFSSSIYFSWVHWCSRIFHRYDGYLLSTSLFSSLASSKDRQWSWGLLAGLSKWCKTIWEAIWSSELSVKSFLSLFYASLASTQWRWGTTWESFSSLTIFILTASRLFLRGADRVIEKNLNQVLPYKNTQALQLLSMFPNLICGRACCNLV